MRVGYAKLGRSMPLSLARCGILGGDVEVAAVVKILAERNPGDEFVLIGRNSGEDPREVGLPNNVINPWTGWRPELRARQNERGLKGNLTVEQQFEFLNIVRAMTGDTFASLDGIVMWDGQHGTTNVPLPSVRDPNVLTKPQDWSAFYCGWLLDGINTWRDVDPWNREEVHLNSDARNYLKLRDIKWPLRHPILTQYNFDNAIKHARYGDGADFEEWSGHDLCGLDDPSHRNLVWKSKVHNVYSRLEINALSPDTPFGNLVSYDEEWSRRRHFGVIANETRSYVGLKNSRREILRDWVLPIDPAFIHGTWSKTTLESLGINISPVSPNNYFPALHSVRSMFTMPSSGSGWATVKAWECFAAGTVCFMHPRYDEQDHILQDADPNLRYFLRVDSPETLAHRVKSLDADPTAWLWLVRAQREHLMKALDELTYAKMIEHRLGLT